MHTEDGCQMSDLRFNDPCLNYWSRRNLTKADQLLTPDRGLLERLPGQGVRYARECRTWDRKAQLMTKILTWAVGQGPKPDLRLPKDAVPTKLLARFLEE